MKHYLYLYGILEPLHSVFFVSFIDDFEKALSAGFIQATDYVEIWQAYLDYLRRRVDFSKGWRSLCSYSVTVFIMC